MLNKTIIFLSIVVESKPYITVSKKFEVFEKAEGFYLLNIHYGFSESVHLPHILEILNKEVATPFHLNTNDLAYFIEIIALEISRNPDIKDTMPLWQKHLFSFMLRNAVPDIQFYHLPHNKTVAIGAYYQL